MVARGEERAVGASVSLLQADTVGVGVWDIGVSTYVHIW